MRYPFPELILTPAGGLLHELSNEGARTQFENFLEAMILPALVSSAQVSPVHVFVSVSRAASRYLLHPNLLHALFT